MVIPMSKTIFLCASMDFYKELVNIEKQLVTKGFTVKIPHSAQIMKKKNDFEVSHFKGVFTYEQRKKFIHDNFKEIEKSDAILVINNEKKGIQGYIGTNVLMEIALAFYFHKKIYVLNPVSESSSSYEELMCFGVDFINKNLEKVI